MSINNMNSTTFFRMIVSTPSFNDSDEIMATAQSIVDSVAARLYRVV